MPVVNFSEAEFGTVTRAVVPLNRNALPNFPAGAHVAPVSVPLLALPDESPTAVPVPSLKAYAATRPLVCAWRYGRWSEIPRATNPTATTPAMKDLRGTRVGSINDVRFHNSCRITHALRMRQMPSLAAKIRPDGD